MRTENVWMAVRRGLRVGPWIFGVVAMAVSGLSCRNLTRQAPAEGPVGTLVKDGEVSILMTRLGQYPKRLVTSADKVAVRFYFDPQLIDLTKVTGYSLWSLEGSTRTWRRIGAASPDALPLEIQPDEGVHGLRASVTCTDGRERLVPSSNDEPAVWLCVDRTPPAITWVSPTASSPIRGVRSLELKWTTNEVQFGSSKARLEWSADRGRTWKPIGEVPAAYGEQGYRWRLPAEVSSDILVRVNSQDLAGHESSAVLALTYPGSVSAGGPAIAMTPSVGEGAEKQPAKSADATGSGMAPATAPAESGLAEPKPTAANPSLAEPGTAEPRAESTSLAETVASSGGSNASKDASAPPAAGPAPEVGDPPAGPAPPEGAAPGPLALEIVSSPRGVRAPGSTAAVAWKPLPDALSSAPDSTVDAETSSDSGQSWEAVGHARLADGRIEWALPSRSVAQGSVRLVTNLSGGASANPVRSITLARERFSVDADAPKVAIVDLPEVLGSKGRISVNLSDGAGSGVDRAIVYLRRGGSKEWKELDESHARLDGGNLDVDLSGEAEDAYDLWLKSVDKAGNASRGPSDDPGPLATGDTQDPFGRFRLDRTPPSITVRAAPAAWVAGFQAELFVDVDWTDGVPPLVLEGEDDGGWKELGRWVSVSPDQNRFAFIVPAGITRPGVTQYGIRFSVTDSAGNKAYGDAGKHAVEPAVRLKTFADGKPHVARDSEKVTWMLHPVAQEVADELTVELAHEPKAGANWVLLNDKLTAKSDYYWDLPEGDNEMHRLRARVLRKGKVVGEDVSPPFAIAGSTTVAPTVVRIKEDSIFQSEQAQKLAQKFFAAAEAGTSGAAEIERLQASVVSAYEKALNIDSSNYHASYGLAQFLNRLDSEKNAGAVARWLQKTIDVKPDHLWALNDLGAACIREGQFQKAEEFLRKSASIEEAPVVLYNLGLALFFGGKQADARKRLEAALKAGKGSLPEGEIYYYLVQSYLQEGNIERAKSLFGEKQTSIPADMREEIAKAIQG